MSINCVWKTAWCGWRRPSHRCSTERFPYWDNLVHHSVSSCLLLGWRCHCHSQCNKVELFSGTCDVLAMNGVPAAHARHCLPSYTFNSCTNVIIFVKCYATIRTVLHSSDTKLDIAFRPDTRARSLRSDFSRLPMNLLFGELQLNPFNQIYGMRHSTCT